MTFLVTWGEAVRREEFHSCSFKSSTRVSDASVHMDTHTAPLKEAQDGCKVYWDSQKNRLQDKFPIWFKIRLWSLQSDWWSQIEIGPAPLWQEHIWRVHVGKGCCLSCSNFCACALMRENKGKPSSNLECLCLLRQTEPDFILFDCADLCTSYPSWSGKLGHVSWIC